VLCELVDGVPHLDVGHPAPDDVAVDVDLRLRASGTLDPRVLFLREHHVRVEDRGLDEAVERTDLPLDVLIEQGRNLPSPCHPHVHERLACPSAFPLVSGRLPPITAASLGVAGAAAIAESH
jgi:hypothetical protein